MELLAKLHNRGVGPERVEQRVRVEVVVVRVAARARSAPPRRHDGEPGRERGSSPRPSPRGLAAGPAVSTPREARAGPVAGAPEERGSQPAIIPREVAVPIVTSGREDPHQHISQIKMVAAGDVTKTWTDFVEAYDIDVPLVTWQEWQTWRATPGAKWRRPLRSKDHVEIDQKDEVALYNFAMSEAWGATWKEDLKAVRDTSWRGSGRKDRVQAQRAAQLEASRAAAAASAARATSGSPRTENTRRLMSDLVNISNTALNQTGRAVECIAIIMALYLALSLLTSALMRAMLSFGNCTCLTHSVSTAISASDNFALFNGIFSSALAWRTALRSKLFSGSPGTMAGPCWRCVSS